MLRYYFLLSLITISLTSNSQEKKYKFYNLNQILTDINEKGEKSKYFSKIDIEAVLALDFDSYKIFQRIDNKFISRFGIDTIYHTRTNKVWESKNFDCHLKNVVDFFADTNLFQSTLRNMNNDPNDVTYKLLKYIYIKDESAAVFTVTILNVYLKYKVTLHNNYITIDLLNQGIAD